MNTTTEERIQELDIETKKSVEEIIDGSDEHLDMILSIINPLNSLIEKFQEFNYSCEKKFNFYSNDQLQIFLPKLKELNLSCLSLIGAVKTSFLYCDVRECLKKYIAEYNLLKELIHDVQIRISKDEEFDNLLLELHEASSNG